MQWLAHSTQPVAVCWPYSEIPPHRACCNSLKRDQREGDGASTPPFILWNITRLNCLLSVLSKNTWFLLTLQILGSEEGWTVWIIPSSSSNFISVTSLWDARLAAGPERREDWQGLLIYLYFDSVNWSWKQKQRTWKSLTEYKHACWKHLDPFMKIYLGIMSVSFTIVHLLNFSKSHCHLITRNETAILIYLMHLMVPLVYGKFATIRQQS